MATVELLLHLGGALEDDPVGGSLSTPALDAFLRQAIYFPGKAAT
jgi:hypothetical protein